MTDRNVSDLVFRDLEPDAPAGRQFDDEWEASLREELEKLRQVRYIQAPRVIPAADTGDRPARRGRSASGRGGRRRGRGARRVRHARARA